VKSRDTTPDGEFARAGATVGSRHASTRYCAVLAAPSVSPVTALQAWLGRRRKKIELYTVSGGVFEKELDLAGQWHVISCEGNAVGAQPALDGPEVAASERNVIERAGGVRGSKFIL